MLVRVPNGIWHGWKCVSPEEAYIVNAPTDVYRYDAPDQRELPHDSPEIPYGLGRAAALSAAGEAMLRWFVTGAGGQLATAFAETLDGEVFLSHEEVLDIRDAEAVRVAVHGFGPDVILHTAAFTDVDGAEANPQAAADVNVQGTRNVLASVRRTHATVVYFSTDYVFDGTKAARMLRVTRRTRSGARTHQLAAEDERARLGALGVRAAHLVAVQRDRPRLRETIWNAARRQAAGGSPLRVPSTTRSARPPTPVMAIAAAEALIAASAPVCIVRPAAATAPGVSSPARGEARRPRGGGRAHRHRRAAPAGTPRPRLGAASERPVPRLPHWAEGAAAAVELHVRRLSGADTMGGPPARQGR